MEIQDSQSQSQYDSDIEMNLKLEQLFRACDTKGTGYIGSDELRDICAGLGIGSSDSDTLFTDLDHDQDGKIDFHDFVKGFSEFVSPPQKELLADSEEIQQQTSHLETTSTEGNHDRISGRYLRNHLKQQNQSPEVWKHFLDQLSTNSSRTMNSKKLEELRGILQNISNSPQLATCFEDIVKTLLQDVQRLQQDNERLETVYKTEKEKHEQHLRQIEEEIDSQVSKVEAKIKLQMREEAEAERKALKLKMDEEMSDLQAHLKLFQTFDNMLKKDHGDDEQIKKMQNKLEEASFENRKLKMSLTDTKTNIALLHSELAQLRAQYEEKCMELHSERESVYDYLHEQDHFSKQLHLLQEANKRLQDVNDSIWSAMETNNNNNSPTVTSKQVGQSPTAARRRSLCKRGSVIGDYLQEERSTSTGRLPEIVPSKSQRVNATLLSPPETEVDSLYESMNDRSPHTVSPQGIRSRDIVEEEELNFGMKRFMEDLSKMVQNDNNASTPKETRNGEEYHAVPSRKTSTTNQITILDSKAEDEFEEIELDGPAAGWAVLPVGQTLPPLSRNSRKTGYVRHQSIGRAQSRQSLAGSQLLQMTCNTSLDCYEPTGPPDRMYKVVFAGDAAVGKTTFILRISKGVFVPTLTSTLGVDFHVKTLRVDEKNVTLQLWDTAGQERFRSVTKSYFRRADGVMLLYDCTSEHSFLHVREWMETIDEVAEKRVPVMLCANKTDLRETAYLQGKTYVGTDDGERLAREFSAIFIETSAKNGRNMVDALIQLTREMASNEDWEVQTSGLRIADTYLPKRSGICCK